MSLKRERRESCDAWPDYIGLLMKDLCLIGNRIFRKSACVCPDSRRKGKEEIEGENKAGSREKEKKEK